MCRVLLLFALAAVSLAGTAPGGAMTTSLPASTDVGLPFWCDWRYDWEARCFRDDGRRLPIGGVDDKVWRAALRFPLERIPARAAIASAELRLYYDGVCVAPRLASTPCAAPGAVIDAHRILSTSWFAEREPEIDGRVAATAVVFSAPDPQWLVWDVTELVRSWHAGLMTDNGLLLKLQDGDEDFGIAGPYGPSSGYPDPSLRPRLVVGYARFAPR